MHLAVCDLNQHRLIILCRMVGEGSRGRKRRLPGTIEPCKERRHCGADRCDEQLVGTSISQHYKSKTPVLHSDGSEINILVRNDKFYSENAFGPRFQCLQLFIGFSMQFIDFPDIG